MKRSKYMSLIIIALIVWILWLIILTPHNALTNLIHNWQIAVTMIFGSMIAGATSVGGGAIAFPVFTKILQIEPHDAKVFSLAIQSVGMGAATLTIYLSNIAVEWRVILWSTLGGLIGIVIGQGLIALVLIPSMIKMSFTVMLVSFAITLFALNRNQRKVHEALPIFTIKEISILFIAGIIGGLMSGLVGNGIDIIVFSVMVLLFRISEKVATPTSVILMAFNAMAGFGLSVFVFDNFTAQAESYWLAAIPVVVVGAPLGAVLCSLMNRETIARTLIILILIELISSLLIIRLTPVIISSSMLMLVLFSGLNYWMYRTQYYQPTVLKMDELG